jgi:hypothetical protein
MGVFAGLIKNKNKFNPRKARIRKTRIYRKKDMPFEDGGASVFIVDALRFAALTLAALRLAGIIVAALFASLIVLFAALFAALTTKADAAPDGTLNNLGLLAVLGENRPVVGEDSVFVFLKSEAIL